MNGPVIPWRWVGVLVDVRAALIDDHGWCFSVDDLAIAAGVDTTDLPIEHQVVAADLVDRHSNPLRWLPAAAALTWAWSLPVINLWEWLSGIDREQQASTAELVDAARHQAPGLLAPATFSVSTAAEILSNDPMLRLGRTGLFDEMSALGWISRPHPDADWAPAPHLIREGLAIVRPTRVPGRHDLYRQIRLTPDGIHTLHRTLGGLTDINPALAAAMQRELA